MAKEIEKQFWQYPGTFLIPSHGESQETLALLTPNLRDQL